MNSSDLKIILKNFGWNQTEFAKQLGVSKSLMSAWVRGTKPILERNEKAINNLIARVKSEYGNDPEPYSERYDYDLSAFRKQLRLKQSDLSTLTGLSQSQISNIENGTNELSEKHLETIRKKYPSIENFKKNKLLHNPKDPDYMEQLLRKSEAIIESQQAQISLLQRMLEITEAENESLKKDNFFSTVPDPKPDEGDPDKKRAN